MVDFNNEGTISRPPRDIVALIIIEKLYNYLEADEFWTAQSLNGVDSRLNTARSRLRNLFLTTHSMIQRRLPPEQYQKVRAVTTDLNKKVTPQDLLDCFIILHEQLDKLGLIKLDTRPVYDSLDIEASNKAQGYN